MLTESVFKFNNKSIIDFDINHDSEAFKKYKLELMDFITFESKENNLSKNQIIEIMASFFLITSDVIYKSLGEYSLGKQMKYIFDEGGNIVADELPFVANETDDYCSIFTNIEKSKKRKINEIITSKLNDENNQTEKDLVSKVFEVPLPANVTNNEKHNIAIKIDEYLINTTLHKELAFEMLAKQSSISSFTLKKWHNNFLTIPMTDDLPTQKTTSVTYNVTITDFPNITSNLFSVSDKQQIQHFMINKQHQTGMLIKHIVQQVAEHYKKEPSYINGIYSFKITHGSAPENIKEEITCKLETFNKPISNSDKKHIIEKSKEIINDYKLSKNDVYREFR